MNVYWSSLCVWLKVRFSEKHATCKYHDNPNQLIRMYHTGSSLMYINCTEYYIKDIKRQDSLKGLFGQNCEPGVQVARHENTTMFIRLLCCSFVVLGISFKQIIFVYMYIVLQSNISSDTLKELRVWNRYELVFRFIN